MKKCHIFFRSVIVLGLVFCMPILIGSSAKAADPVKVSVLTDMSGPYAGITASNVEAAKMAVKDFGEKLLGQDIVFVYRDHLCKADVANQKAKELYEKEKVDVIFDCPNSAAGLAVSKQALIHKKLFFSIGSGTTRHTGADCNRYTFDWAYNDYMLATSVGLWAADNLGKKWYTITADYAWGHDLLKHFKHALESKGGKLLGNDMVALGTADFSPYIICSRQFLQEDCVSFYDISTWPGGNLWSSPGREKPDSASDHRSIGLIIVGRHTKKIIYDFIVNFPGIFRFK